ncbi:MAG TPA: hypothetical protein VGO33_03925 [Gemmatimonadaceae bacterium]|jgi:hypothetical protein|nr:hypothetical protein [Gemmatimonadaceae bacterium]
MPYRDDFGFVPLPVRLDFGEGRIEPLPSVQSAIDGLSAITHPDGFIYPPTQYTQRELPNGELIKVPGSDRNAFLYQLPATHTLTLTGKVDQTIQRYGDAGFVIHLFGRFYGWRCQFHDWWIDGRSKGSSDADHLAPRHGEAEACMRAALVRFRSWAAIPRMVAINAMYLHGRIWSYESEWERFQAAYQVTDALFAIARDTGIIAHRAKISHGERIAVLCDDLGLYYDEKKFEYVVRLRNELLHQALWAGGMPGHAGPDDRSFYAAIWLENLTRRALYAVCGLQGTYLSSSWSKLTTHFFDVKPVTPDEGA